MTRDAVTTERLSKLLAQLKSLTRTGGVHWEKQLGSAHRYARWKNLLLILGPTVPLSETRVPRYLFITPFDSPACAEVNSDNPDLGPALLELVVTVESASKNEAPTDPFALTEDILSRLGD